MIILLSQILRPTAVNSPQSDVSRDQLQIDEHECKD